MKKLLTLALVFVIGATCASAQTQKEINKENRARDRYTEQQLNEKAPKSARKAAKKDLREGWTVAPGHLPLDKQYEMAYTMRIERDAEGFIYITGDGQSIGENYDAAKMQALELAKMNLAGQIETEITALVESTVANKQLEANEAASIVETIQASKNVISKRIGRVVPVVEVYRESRNKNKEVRVLLFYNRKTGMESAKQVIREELQKKGDKLHEKLDQVLGF